MKKSISVLWKSGAVSGNITVTNVGTLDSLSGADSVSGAAFSFTESEGRRLNAAFDGAKLEPGNSATIIGVRTEKNPFSFFLRDVCACAPIYIPEYNVIVTEESDARGYCEIVEAIRTSGRLTKIEQIQNQPEESFCEAAKRTRNMPCDIWLGLSRDVRMFEARIHTTSNPAALWDTIQPMYHHTGVKIPEMEDVNIRYDYFAGRGIGIHNNVERWLEQSVLPILNVKDVDGDVHYYQKLFVTNEIAPLNADTLKGSHYLISDKYAAHPTARTPEQQAETDRIFDAEINRDDETVAYLKVEAVNTANVARYAFMRIPQPNVFSIPEMSRYSVELDADGLNFFAGTGRVFMTAKVNGKPVTDVEYAILLAPGEKAQFEFKIPHRPIPRERALALQNTDFGAKLQECIDFWNAKLDTMACINIPEKRIDDMMKAGFLHLDLVCFGSEPDGPVAPTVGVYTPIGTESTPIIQYIESVGATDLARRSIEYFLAKQRPDGFMQNFQTYMSETGLGLWNAAEHYKYTGDLKWLESIKDNLIRGCDYIMRWTDENKDEKLRKKGYGMISGKVADCEYPYHSFMLNAITLAGVESCAEVLELVDPAAAKKFAAFAAEYKSNILESLDEAYAKAPVIPASDGTWCPSNPSWPETDGALCLKSDKMLTFSHGSMVEISDGGHYEIMYGLIDKDSAYGKFVLKSTSELDFLDNTAFSQPYYSPHPYTHLLKGEVKPFLKEFYSLVSALADRETYTFWEHLYQVSPHKTHEEGWFLMRCRWMLFLDTFGELKLLPGVPRKWLENGKEISFCGMNSRFGKLSVCAKSEVSLGRISVKVKLDAAKDRIPSEISVRVPHPDSMRATAVSMGEYCAKTETVYLSNFTGEAEFTLTY